MKSLLKLLRGEWLAAKPQHIATPKPSNPVLRYVASCDALIGRALVGLHAATWTSDMCNNAMFAFELDRGDYFMFSNRWRDNTMDVCFVKLSSEFHPVSQITYGEPNNSRVFGCRSKDLLAPANPDDRMTDSQVLLLSSGYGLTLVTGEPMGILPSLYLIEPDFTTFASLRSSEIRPDETRGN